MSDHRDWHAKLDYASFRFVMFGGLIPNTDVVGTPDLADRMASWGNWHKLAFGHSAEGTPFRVVVDHTGLEGDRLLADSRWVGEMAARHSAGRLAADHVGEADHLPAELAELVVLAHLLAYGQSLPPSCALSIPCGFL